MSGLEFSLLRYGSENELQQVGVWTFPEKSRNSDGYWVIFVHGGAWRDPTISHSSFLPTIEAVLGDPSVDTSSIRAFANIDYRLSPHPRFPEDPDATPFKRRTARHPDHLVDVRSALAFLQREHGLGQKYILIGHSVGATLAFQVLMGESALLGRQAPAVPLPACVIGCSGIYEFDEFCSRNDPSYAEFLEGGLGPDRARWNDVAPICFGGNYRSAWPGDVFALLAFSPDDGLVDALETENMSERLRSDKVPHEVVRITGTHDEAWQLDKIGRLVLDVLARLSRTAR